jgi:hypothetical protein
LFRSFRHELDPLDLEILEKAFNAAWSAVKENDPPIDFDSDEGLEAILRGELVEIARFHGVSDPETLRDILLDPSAAGHTVNMSAKVIEVAAKSSPANVTSASRHSNCHY